MSQTLKDRNILIGEFKNRNTKEVYQVVKIEKNKVYFRNYVNKGKDFFMSYQDFLKYITTSSKWLQIGLNEDESYFICVNCEYCFHVEKPNRKYIKNTFYKGMFFADLCDKCFNELEGF